MPQPPASRQRRRARLAALGALSAAALAAVGLINLALEGDVEGGQGVADRISQEREEVFSRTGSQGATPVRWRRSKALGTHAAGRLRRGVALPAEGREWVSWDPILKRRPNREWRRWGTDRLARTTLRVMREFGRDHPDAPRVAVGDLSRPRGGDFGPRFGSIGHASHQNGLDVDVYYPRVDRRLRPAKHPGQVNLDLAQDLLDRFVAAGAERVFVGPSLGLEGPPEVVMPLVNHDDHLHVRLPLD